MATGHTDHTRGRGGNWVLAAFVAITALLGFYICTDLPPLIKILAAVALTFAVLVFLVEIETGIYLYFIYLFFDAFIKINANHNPILHVAVDLLAISLLVRSLYERESFGAQKFLNTPRFGFILIFTGWVALQYLNPFGLGFLPSLAGSKVYLTAPAIFLLVYHHIPLGRQTRFFTFLVGLGIFQGLLACIEYLYLQDWVIALNPYYAAFCKLRFAGVLYRPFGTTTFPGGACVWIFITAPACGNLIYARTQSWGARLALGVIYLAVAVPTLVVCQVRVAILVTGLSLLACAVMPGHGWARRGFTTLIVGGLLTLLIVFYGEGYLAQGSRATVALTLDQREMLAKRLETLGDRSTYTQSRTGAWDESMALAAKQINGIGLSRVGAAAEPWAERIDGDPYFGRRWSFADNLFRALFTELGVFGLTAWLLLVLVLLSDTVRAAISGRNSGDSVAAWCCATGALVLVASGFGSEGVLYNPVSSVLWAYIGLGFRQAVYSAPEEIPAAVTAAVA